MEHVISRTHHCIDEGGDREKIVVEMRLGTHISPQRILDLAASMVVAES